MCAMSLLSDPAAPPRPSVATAAVAALRRHALAIIGVLAGVALLHIHVDRPLAEWIFTLHPDHVEPFQWVTWLGDSKYSLVPIATVLPLVLAVHYGLREGRAAELAGWLAGALIFVFAAIALSGILVNVIKFIIGRARPGELYLHGFYGFVPFTFDSDFHSFPSGHANTLFAIALALGCFVPRLRLALLGLAAAIASSRVAIGAHYPGDVIGGAALAVATTYALRHWCAGRGWVFAFGPGGRIDFQPSGRRLRRRARALGRRIVAQLRARPGDGHG